MYGCHFRGRWHSSDVAIKIMSCTADELPKMLKEAEVMMQLNHPNIVRAFHASVWNPAEQARALKVSMGILSFLQSLHDARFPVGPRCGCRLSGQ